MPLRTRMFLTVYCTNCHWESRPMRESEPVPSKCPVCSERQPLKEQTRRFGSGCVPFKESK